MSLLNSSLHDFGFRGCTSVEQAIIGGSAHLLNFKGTDNMAAAYYSQYHLNNGEPVGFSIPASEHSVMTSHASEKDAILQIIQKYGKNTYSIVFDSYDYTNALKMILPTVAEYKLKKGGFLVIRPDSGDPVKVVLEALKALDLVFGSDLNQKGFKVLRKCSVIQGDGMSLISIQLVLKGVIENKFAVSNVVFGMGGGLLQKLDRDTLSFATKLSFIKFKNNTTKNISKSPKTDLTKSSLPGLFSITRLNNIPTVYPSNKVDERSKESMLQIVYDNGKVFGFDDGFKTIRERIESEWKMLPKIADPISTEMKKLLQ